MKTTEQSRDFSEAQFRAAAQAAGFEPDALGYWRLPAPHTNTSVYRFNGGSRRRAQLAYMLAQQERLDLNRSTQ